MEIESSAHPRPNASDAHASGNLRQPWQAPRLQHLITSSATQNKHSGCQEQGTSFASPPFCS